MTTGTTHRSYTIQLANDGAGRFAAYRQEEPAFWFTRDSEAAVVAIAEQVLRDYQSRFGRTRTSSAATRNVVLHQFQQTRERETA